MPWALVKTPSSTERLLTTWWVMSGGGEDRTMAIGDGRKEVVGNSIAGNFKILKRLIIVVKYLYF